MKAHLGSALLALALLAACGEQGSTGPSVISAQQYNDQVVKKFISDLPAVSGTLEIKGIKIGMNYKDVMKMLNLKPSRCCHGGDLVYVTQYFPETDQAAPFPEGSVPISPDYVPGQGGAPIDISALKDDQSVRLQGAIEILGEVAEFTATFPNGRLELLEISKISGAEYEKSETHVLVDAFVQKFNVAPKVLKIQDDTTYQTCHSNNKLSENQAKICADTFTYMAGFKDANSVLDVEGQKIVFPYAISHKVLVVNLQSKQWFDKQTEVIKSNLARQEKQKEEATRKRNSDL